VTPNTL